ncbi:hypothetical protein ABZ322_44000 [Streptomyces sp. NPDC006129]|uniref:hypothetical protein n=1 Tax=Streptomyces sp. NPDC006129 TaxID=3155348 RepID=UPI0033A567AF
MSPRVWRVLEPVRHELPALSPYVLRRIAREIGTQLDAPGGSEQRLIDRIARRYASTQTIRDVGRWLLGAALVRHGCGRLDCETGVIWPTGTDCEICAVNRQVQRARAQRDRELAARERQMKEQRQHREAERARAEHLHEPDDRAQPRASVLPPRAESPPAQPLPPKRTFRQRDAASDEEVLAAIAEHGPTVALHIYGHLRTLPLLRGLPHPSETGSDRRTHAQ